MITSLTRPPFKKNGMLSKVVPERIGRFCMNGIASIIFVPTTTLPMIVYLPGSNAAALFVWLMNHPLVALLIPFDWAAASVYFTFDKPFASLNSLTTAGPAGIPARLLYL